MNKGVIYSIAAVGAIILIYFSLGMIGIFKVYTIPTSSSEPNIKTHSLIASSSLVSPKNGDFITYKFYEPTLGNHVRVHRMIGLPGDEVRIENGVLYLNGENFDKDIELYFSFSVNEEVVKSLALKKVLKQETMYQITDKMYIVNTSQKIASQYGFENNIVLKSKDEGSKYLYKDFNVKWNIDNFGPVIVPEGKCFVIGDNRHNSQDSRSFGFVDIDDIKGVVIYK